MSFKQTVSERYSQGAQVREEALCCPVDYDQSLLAVLPREIIDKDYGCGDPSRYVRDGDIVLDLGSGGGKVCYMAAQLVGGEGQVIGIDMTDDMLALARRHQSTVAEKIGGDRVTFKKGYIQDLALDVEALQQRLNNHPVSTVEDMAVLESWKRQQKCDAPMIANSSVTLVISNCVLNLVDKADRQLMIEEIFRVLKPGGRVAISDIVCDEPVPQQLQDDATLWSGCISGAFEEREFMQAFINAGFVAVSYDKWDDRPWQVIDNIEFRSVTLIATKPDRNNLYDAGEAVLYRGPYSYVRDDLGNVFPRGERIAVSRRTFELIKNGPYTSDFVCVAPATEINRGCFTLAPGTKRTAAETKGGLHAGTGSGGACC